MNSRHSAHENLDCRDPSRRNPLYVQHDRRVLNRARHRPDVIERQRQRKDAAPAHQPELGFRPTIPQYAAGNRIEPAVSVPSAAKHMPTATAAAAPEDDPPVIRAVSQGLRTGPK